MSWLSSPKVRLALIVNGLYFISLFTPTLPPRATSRLYSRADARRPERLPASAAPTYVPLAPPAAPTKAATSYLKERDQLKVYLTQDLTLVRRLGHTLLLSPTFTARMLTPEQPRSVLMRFVSYSQQQVFDPFTPFVITADGVEVWRSGEDGNGAPLPASATPLHSATYAEGGQVVETFGQEIPYDLFLDIISARRIIVELGDDRVELNAEQVEALRDMHRRLPQPVDEPPPPPAPPRAYGTPRAPLIIKAAPDMRPPDRRH